MNLKTLIEHLDYTDVPVGLTGCQIKDYSFDICDYDIVVFDEQSKSNEIIQFDKNIINVHHGSLKETQSKFLLFYDQMQIIRDESWDLRMLLSKIKEKRITLWNDYAKNCLIESLFCVQKCNDQLNSSNIFASCWQKCACFYLAEAVCALNQQYPSPSHMLNIIRKFKTNFVNKQISIINELIGIERATPILLERMLKSTIGFSEMIEKNNHSLDIQRKHDYFVKNSMLADCYFYLGFINKEIFMTINDIDQKPEFNHVLKIAFDVEVDSAKLAEQAEIIQKSTHILLESFLEA